MTKIGRNHPCPCGSGRKFKKCCGAFDSSSTSPNIDQSLNKFVQQKLREFESERVQREKQQGLGRGIISTEVNGYRIVAVGNTGYQSNQWRTFHDFLRYYIINKLGENWFKTELLRPKNERHQIANWYDKAISDIKENGGKVGELLVAPMTGAQRAFLNLAYNLYLIAHHADPNEEKSLLQVFIDKLKSERDDDFIGKLFETYAAAAFLKAGFKLKYEDESDHGVSHVEFVATNPLTCP
jgi:SEC-C motif